MLQHKLRHIERYPKKKLDESGVYDVVGVTNWRSEVVHKEVSFQEKLGLASGPYVVFDFWGQKFLGIHEGSIDVKVQPHDTEVLLIHPALDHPQLMGTARHISGSFSVDALAWGEPGLRLHGRSTTVAGEPYKLWIRVPKEYTLSSAKASSANREVQAKTESDGELLTLLIPGQEDPIDWEIVFSKKRNR